MNEKGKLPKNTHIKDLTVQELIDKLQQVEDKTAIVGYKDTMGGITPVQFIHPASIRTHDSYMHPHLPNTKPVIIVAGITHYSKHF
jgi:hypothetical protein